MLSILVALVALTAAYALVTTSFVLVLKATNAVNFAHGDFVMIGGYAAWQLGTWFDVPGLVLLPLVLVLMMGVGLLLSLVAYFPLRRAPAVSVFISTIAAGLILENLSTVFFGPEPKSAPALLNFDAPTLAGTSINAQSMMIVVVALVLIVGQYLLFSRTRLGKRLRAVALDPEIASTCGINATGMIAATFVIAAALAGSAGLFLSHNFFVAPTDGANYMIKAYIAATIGGWGSIPGALIGAFIVAVFEVLFPAIPVIAPQLAAIVPIPDVFSESTSMIVLYLALLVVLMFRPRGILGEAAHERA